MKGDWKYQLFLVFIGGLMLEACGLPIIPWIFDAVAGWFSELPDIQPNVGRLIGEFAWPLAIIILAMRFQNEILRILRSIKRLTWGDKSVDLSDDLDALEQEVSEIEPPAEGAGSKLDDKFERLIEYAPAAAILEAWKEIERIIQDLAKYFGVEDSRAFPTRRLFESLRIKQAITASDYHALLSLMNIRNKAVHTDEVSSLDAYRFLKNAQIVKQSLSGALENPPF